MASEADKAEARRQIKVYERDLNAVNAVLKDCNETISFYQRQIASSSKIAEAVFIRKMKQGIKKAEKDRKKFAAKADELTKRIAKLKNTL